MRNVRTYLMDYRRLQASAPNLIMGFGVVLFLIAAVHHARELYALDGSVGPIAAVFLDGLPALGLVYAGYRLSGTDLPPGDRWRVCVWCLLGATLFGTIMGLSLLVRAFEGRVIGEAIFPLLIAIEAGGLAAVIAGYSIVRARTEARRARVVSDTLGFVNSLIRHDLRNDLNTIHGYADLIRTDADSADSERASVIAERADEALTRIETTGVVAETLLGDPDLERVDLAAITVEMASQVENTYDITVTTDLPDHAPVAANAGLESVVDNLLENAVEHNDAEEPRVHVEVETAAGDVRLSVADNGPGIPGEQKQTLLDPRDREAENGGLSLIKTLVEEYGGDMWIEDNDPRGSVFTVEFPRSDTRQG
jgi:signal transduction histidine kinase